MFEIIKSLSPKQRASAFMFTVVISAIVSILTIYLKTDDCGSISDQYTKLVTNQAKLMELNNQLFLKYNNAKNDLLFVDTHLKQMDSLSKIQYTNIEKNTTNYVPIVKNQVEYVYIDSSVGVLAYSKSDTITNETIPPKKTEVKKTVVKPSNELTNIIDSLKEITSKYKTDL